MLCDDKPWRGQDVRMLAKHHGSNPFESVLSDGAGDGATEPWLILVSVKTNAFLKTYLYLTTKKMYHNCYPRAG